MKHLIAPSMLASDFANLESEIKMINKSEADWLHSQSLTCDWLMNFDVGCWSAEYEPPPRSATFCRDSTNNCNHIPQYNKQRSQTWRTISSAASKWRPW